jgi:signal transduction histidine kinase
VVTAQTADGSVQLTVSDTGPGIAVDRIERVFEPFYTTKASGLGMGLPICRRIATAHGGVLVAQSRPDEGATFRLVVPAASAVAHRESVPLLESESRATTPAK